MVGVAAFAWQCLKADSVLVPKIRFWMMTMSLVKPTHHISLLPNVSLRSLPARTAAVFRNAGSVMETMIVWITVMRLLIYAINTPVHLIDSSARITDASPTAGCAMATMIVAMEKMNLTLHAQHAHARLTSSPVPVVVVSQLLGLVTWMMIAVTVLMNHLNVPTRPVSLLLSSPVPMADVLT